jgi:hypothetical protein
MTRWNGRRGEGFKSLPALKIRVKFSICRRHLVSSNFVDQAIGEIGFRRAVTHGDSREKGV